MDEIAKAGFDKASKQPVKLESEEKLPGTPAAGGTASIGR